METHDFFLYLLIILLTEKLFGTTAVASLLLLVQAFAKPHLRDVALVFVATLFLLMGIVIALLNT
jgi:hypothetical protein